MSRLKITIKNEIILYYRDRKIKNLIMKNSITRKNDKLATSLVVYEVQCPRGGQTRNKILTR